MFIFAHFMDIRHSEYTALFAIFGIELFRQNSLKLNTQFEYIQQNNRTLLKTKPSNIIAASN